MRYPCETGGPVEGPGTAVTVRFCGRDAVHFAGTRDEVVGGRGRQGQKERREVDDDAGKGFRRRVVGVPAVAGAVGPVGKLQERAPVGFQCKAKPDDVVTDEVVRMVFGAADAPAVPSPLHEVLDFSGSKGNNCHPAVPHVFVGCRNEVFGQNLLDAFFASEEYSDALKGVHGVDSRYRAVESDHWNVLGSTALRDALEEELGVLHSKMAGKARR